MPKVFMIRRAINHPFCLFWAEVHKEYPFQKSVQRIIRKKIKRFFPNSVLKSIKSIPLEIGRGL